MSSRASLIVAIVFGCGVASAGAMARADAPCSCPDKGPAATSAPESTSEAEVLACPDVTASADELAVEQEAILAGVPGATERRRGSNLSVFRVPRQDVLATVESLRRELRERGLRDVLVEPVHVYRPLSPTPRPTPTDPWFKKQWSLNNDGTTSGCVKNADINALEAWGQFGRYEVPGDEKIVIAVVDDGMNLHPDLLGDAWLNLAEGKGAAGGDDDGNGYKDDERGIDAATHQGLRTAELTDPGIQPDVHGTGVASIIAASGDDGRAMAGVVWKARLMVCRYHGPTPELVECLRYIAALRDAGANIVAVNLSWGDTGCSCCVEREIRRLRDRGILFVASAGDDGADNDNACGVYPACNRVSNVIAVAASSCGDKFSQSNFGRRTVHVVAPGDRNPVLSHPIDTIEVQLGATSAAAPHVTGVIALLKAQDPGRDWRALRNLVLAGGTPDLGPFTNTIISGRRLRAWDDNGQGSMTCVNQTVRRRLLPVPDVIDGTVGAPVPLLALSITCAKPAGPVSVTLDGGAGMPLPDLLDDGAAPDESAGDGEFSGSWTPTAAGTFTLKLWGGDAEALTITVK